MSTMVTVDGRLVADAEIKYWANEKVNVSMKIASNRGRQINGEWKTDFFIVDSWSTQVINLAKNGQLFKGRQVVVYGALETFVQEFGDRQIDRCKISANYISPQGPGRKNVETPGNGYSEAPPLDRATEQAPVAEDGNDPFAELV